MGCYQTKQRELNLLPGNETTLRIDAQRNGRLLCIQVRDGSDKKSRVAFPRTHCGGLILVTLLGSAVSAAIGFVVQEFLRSRKAA